MTVDLDQRRAELLDLRTQVLTAAHDIVSDDDDQSELSSAAGDQHLADHASDMFDREVDESLEENAEQLVHEIDTALTRIEEGTYGTCARCGGAFGKLPGSDTVSLNVEDCKRIEERV